MVCIRSLCILGMASLGACAAIDIKEQSGSNPKNQAWTTSEYCTGYYTVTLGDTCWDIIARNQNKFTMSQLLCWNTDINPWCSNLIPGRQVCVAVSLPGLAC